MAGRALIQVGVPSTIYETDVLVLGSKTMPFTVDFAPSAADDLAVFEKHEQTRILDRIAIQLPHQPMVETRNRKPLEPNSLGEWEFRIGKFRVFYDVDEACAAVKVKAVGCKEHNKLYIRRKEYLL